MKKPSFHILTLVGILIPYLARADISYCPASSADFLQALPAQIEAANKKLQGHTPENEENFATFTPDWLKKYIGVGKDQIAPVVLERARNYYLNAKAEGRAKNPCYMAMDATRPHFRSEGEADSRFYIICEKQKIFLPVSAGHGSGIKFGNYDYQNGKKCSKYFSNALGSSLTMGGRYITYQQYDSKKGIRVDAQTGEETPFSRVFIRLAGEGETENSLDRDIGAHAAELIKKDCYKYQPTSPYAEEDGYVYYGKQESYVDGRSNGCLSYRQEVSDFVAKLVAGKPTTLYIYPESSDIASVQKPDGGYPYWNQECLKEIGSPQFLSKEEYGARFADIEKQKNDLSAQKKAANPNWRPLCPGEPAVVPTLDSNTPNGPKSAQ